jgi:hypothetical protein
MSSPGELNDWLIGSGAAYLPVFIDFSRPVVFPGGKVNLQVISVYD